ncbi:MAG: saccharopine dehydrogenase NADP-binding domain-containing protein [Leptospiraceae bacterium]|nr:saccharopine dehydrogenase NADP-binding domain-containing protein [Leptospiraceae bacterium]MCB1171573.1 saccharopine dehydrogenase NADP-binding domain-containing protein [Leptospiraceae bacterium]
MKSFLIYGASGYTGELIARRCKEKKLPAILAGRNPDKIRPLAEELDLPFRIFDLADTQRVRGGIKDCFAVLHCAGPFVHTAEPMAQACIDAGVHYLDITGEIPVFETIHALDDRAKKGGVALMPGTGFDVVPTDCAASMVAAGCRVPTDLDIAFFSLGQMSRGTMKSALLQMPNGNRIRREGKVIGGPLLKIKKTIRLAGKDRTGFSIPWGDVFTAGISTGIPNITVYSMVPGLPVFLAPVLRPFTGLLKSAGIQNFLRNRIDAGAPGPDEKTRNDERSYVYAKAWNREDPEDFAEVELETMEGYQFTVESSLAVLSALEHKPGLSGFLTASMAFGSEFVLSLPNTKVMRKLPVS